MALTQREASKILAQMYGEAPRGELVAYIHLFGIKYAKDSNGLNIAEIVKGATGVSDSYHVEVSKGVKLAKHVVLKQWIS